jgi:hypothetical protein
VQVEVAASEGSGKREDKDGEFDTRGERKESDLGGEGGSWSEGKPRRRGFLFFLDGFLA